MRVVKSASRSSLLMRFEGCAGGTSPPSLTNHLSQITKLSDSHDSRVAGYRVHQNKLLIESSPGWTTEAEKELPRALTHVLHGKYFMWG
jgi:hypothetical protein